MKRIRGAFSKRVWFKDLDSNQNLMFRKRGLRYDVNNLLYKCNRIQNLNFKYLNLNTFPIPMFNQMLSKHFKMLSINKSLKSKSIKEEYVPQTRLWN